MAAINIQDLTKQFGDVVAVNGLDLRIEEGEIFGFLGPNGAGKSTTIDIILDFIRPTAGSVSVFGHDAQRESLTVRQRTGVLPDAYHVYDRLTGKQHVEFAIDLKGADEDPMDVLERVGIAEAAGRKAGGYSRGMKQRLVMGIAILGQPDLLILDEPSTGLDPNGAQEMREIIQAENDRGATVFFSSHVMEQVEAVSDRVGIINRGELVTVDSVQGLRSASGGGETLFIQLADITEADRDQIMAIRGVTSVVLDDGRLRVTIGDRPKIRVLQDIDEIARIEDFTAITSSLTDLFHHYTREQQEIEQ